MSDLGSDGEGSDAELLPGPGSWWAAWGPAAGLALNLANATLGAGTLGLPFVAARAGVLGALLLLAGASPFLVLCLAPLFLVPCFLPSFLLSFLRASYPGRQGWPG